MSLTTMTLAQSEQQGRPFLSVDQSRRVDQIAMEQFGIPGQTLMANAGERSAQRILQLAGVRTLPTYVLAGPGNNGGDGYVIARILLAAGCDVRVLALADPDRLRGDARWAWTEAVSAGVGILVVSDASELAGLLGQHNGMVVDCLLGTGATGNPREPMATAIRLSNQGRDRTDVDVSRIAIDLPSGFCGDTGRLFEPHFEADLTLTFVAAKIGMRTANRASELSGTSALGEVEIVDIGIPDAILTQVLAVR